MRKVLAVPALILALGLALAVGCASKPAEAHVNGRTYHGEAAVVCASQHSYKARSWCFFYRSKNSLKRVRPSVAAEITDGKTRVVFEHVADTTDYYGLNGRHYTS